MSERRTSLSANLSSSGWFHVSPVLLSVNLIPSGTFYVSRCPANLSSEGAFHVSLGQRPGNQSRPYPKP